MLTCQHGSAALLLVIQTTLLRYSTQNVKCLTSAGLAEDRCTVLTKLLVVRALSGGLAVVLCRLDAWAGGMSAEDVTERIRTFKHLQACWTMVLARRSRARPKSPDALCGDVCRIHAHCAG